MVGDQDEDGATTDVSSRDKVKMGGAVRSDETTGNPSLPFQRVFSARREGNLQVATGWRDVTSSHPPPPLSCQNVEWGG